MIKLICIVKRRPELSYDEFLQHWRINHAALITQHAQVLGIKRYIQNHAINADDAQSRIKSARNMIDVDFDGIAELWYEDFETHLNARKTPEGLSALEKIIADEKRFIDLSQSRMWYSTEFPVV